MKTLTGHGPVGGNRQGPDTDQAAPANFPEHEAYVRQGTTRSTDSGNVPASRILSAALLWACAALVAFAILIANSQPKLAFGAMVGVVTVWVVREAMRP